MWLYATQQVKLWCPSHSKYICQPWLPKLKQWQREELWNLHRELGITRAIIEGNSKSICKDLLNLSPSLALHGLLIQDAQDLAFSFISISFSHVCHQGNIVAHSLARREILSPSLNVWTEDVPQDILQFVQADLIALSA